MGVFAFIYFSTPSYFIFKLDFKNDALISICLHDSAVVPGRQEWEQQFPASPEEQGECEGGNPIGRITLSLKSWKLGCLLAEGWKDVFQMLHSCST